MHAYICTQAHTHSHTHTCTHTRTHAHMHTCTEAYMGVVDEMRTKTYLFLQKACEMILHIVSVLPSGAEPSTRDIGVSGSGRQLQFLECSAAEVLPYCIHLMITCFRVTLGLKCVLLLS